MRLFHMIRNKKSVIAIVIITILSTAGILTTAVQLQGNILQIQTTREFTNVTANVDNVSPSQNTTVNVTVTGPVGGAVKVVCHYQTSDVSYSGVIKTNGKAIIPVNVGIAVPKYQVFVDVYVTSDKTYTAQTMFIPQ